MGKVEQRRARVIDAIVAAATEVMTEGGAASLSLGEVARRVGMRTPSLYGYFGSRAALCDEIFRRGWESYRALNAGVVITPESDLVGLVSEAVRRAVDWANEHRAAAELMFWRPIPAWHPSPAAFAPAIASMADAVDAFAAARAVGLLRPDADPEEAAQVMAALIAGVVSQQLANEPGAPAESGRTSRYADVFAAMLINHYAPKEDR